jgi:hypothetical protein
MPRRSKPQDAEALRQQLIELLKNFRKELETGNLRTKVLALVPAHHLLRDLGSSLVPPKEAGSARDRILLYFRKYPRIVIGGSELMVVSGINEWPRRVRELRVEFGWAILSGTTAKQMMEEGEFDIKGVDVGRMKTDDYILIRDDQDRDSAHRWHGANVIRRKKLAVRDKILEYLRLNVGREVTGEELRYVANEKTEWARRVRELRTELGWPVVTKATGRPDLPVGVYVLEQDRQSPAHDRKIPDPVRAAVLKRDKYRCVKCGWSHQDWNRSDPRFLELHHVEHHARGGSNEEDNLITVCTVCHDDIHRRER